MVNSQIFNIATPDTFWNILRPCTNISSLYSSCLFTILYYIIWSYTNGNVYQQVQVSQITYYPWFQRLVQWN